MVHKFGSLPTTIGVAIGTLIFVGSIETESASAFVVYSDRAAFQAQLESLITDDYESDGYKTDSTGFSVLSDSAMSNVLGETQYTSTGYPDSNYVIEYPFSSTSIYCAGCNGSFLLDFTQTSVGTSSGVFGAGFDFAKLSDYVAFVTFGDSTAQNFSLAGSSFFGLTSDKAIKTLHVGLENGGSTQGGYIEIDNLTIGSAKYERVPEPSTILGSVVVGATLIVLHRKRAKSNQIEP